MESYIKPHIVEDNNCPMGYVDKGDRLAIWLFSQSLHMEIGEEIVHPYLKSGYSEQLYSSFFMWWKENLT
jgi:hypothetical protein